MLESDPASGAICDYSKTGGNSVDLAVSSKE